MAQTLAIRDNWVPLFDRYGVDLVVCGHEHHYERSHPVRGTLPSDTLTPLPVDTRADVIDTSKGTVHLVIGGGGTSIPSNGMFFSGPPLPRPYRRRRFRLRDQPQVAPLRRGDRAMVGVP